MGISFRYEEKPAVEEHGSNAVEGSSDFPSIKELKKAVKDALNNFQCPNCGGRRMESEKIVVEIGKIRFFKQIQEKGFFGSKYVDKHDRDVYRVHRIYLEPSGVLGFLTPAGYIRCKSCNF
jgi:DNA-directed RNA polymerase subunit RPC12/RpoP